MKGSILLAALWLLLLFASKAAAQVSSDIAGRWITINDHTGDAGSVVEVVVDGDRALGYVRMLMRPERLKSHCDLCKDDRQDQPIIGMQILRGLRRDGNEWVDGRILDPQEGKIYDCKVWVEDGHLKLRGYVGFLYRTQSWIPAGP